MSYCDFCQAVHSSASCFHPGQAKIAALERELAEARKDRAELIEIGYQAASTVMGLEAELELAFRAGFDIALHNVYDPDGCVRCDIAPDAAWSRYQQERQR